MRVVVISFDALEPNFVNTFPNTESLKQKHRGRVDLEPYFTTRPKGVGGRQAITTEVYSVFFTGKLPTIKNYEHFDHFINEVKQHKHDTIFDHAQKPFAVDIPAYSFKADFGTTVSSWLNNVTASPLFSGYFRNVFTLEEAEEAYYSYMKCKTDVMKLFNKLGHDFIYIYYKDSDKLQHLFSKYEERKSNYLEMYKRCNQYTKELIETFDDGETLILVLSDHGAGKTGGHSPWGFWSSNFYLGQGGDIPVQDFYKIVIDFLGKNRKDVDTTEKPISDEDKKILAERLRKLGYVI